MVLHWCVDFTVSAVTWSSHLSYIIKIKSYFLGRIEDLLFVFCVPVFCLELLCQCNVAVIMLQQFCYVYYSHFTDEETEAW